jgi:hypothetical protein
LLTFFTTPKPFRGHIGVIQRNALESWKLLDPDVEIILFGDEEGAAQAAADLGIRHEPDVKRNEHGTKFLTPIFDRAQELASHDLLCYVNCDIVLLSDFREALRRVAQLGGPFLMAGRRWDVDIIAPLDFSSPDWENRARLLAQETNHQRPEQWIDYFAFRRGLFYQNTPPLVIGRPGWDNWLLWRARSSGARLVDASAVVTAVHQNHDYSYHPDGEKGVWEGEEARLNQSYLNGWRYATLQNATHRLTENKLKRSWRHWYVYPRWRYGAIAQNMWFQVLGWTRPIRIRLGLRLKSRS